MKENDFLKNFAKVLGAETKFEEIEEKRRKEKRMLESLGARFGVGLKEEEEKEIPITFIQQPTPVVVIEDNRVVEEVVAEQEPELEVIEENVIPIMPDLPVDTIVTKSVEKIAKAAPKDVQKVVDEIPGTMRKELDAVKKSITDLHRFARNTSQMGGGGEVRLLRLDDVDSSTVADNHYLKYNASTRMLVFDVPAGGNGSIDLLHVGTNIVPNADNTYTLGNTTNRWQSVHIGPGTLFIQDQSNTELNAALTVANGVLQINGANQLQVGQLKFVNNTIESTTGGVDIQIGSTGSTANLVFNRNVVLADSKTITFGDSTTQNTAFTDQNPVLYESIALHTDKQNTDNEYLKIDVIDDHSVIHMTGGSLSFNSGLRVTGMRSATNQINFNSSVQYANGELTYGNLNYAVITGFPQLPSFANDAVASANAISQHGSLERGLVYYDTTLEKAKVYTTTGWQAMN